MSTYVSKNIFWLTASRVVALVLLFFAYSRLFRYLGPFHSGQYQFILSYVTLFSTVVDFGIQQFITKNISEDPENTKKYFQTFFAFEVIVIVILYCLVIGIAWFNHYDPLILKGIAITGVGMMVNALTYPFLSVLTAFQDLKKVALINFLNSLVNIAVIFTAILFHKSILYLTMTQLLFGMLDMGLYLIFIKKHITIPGLGEAMRLIDAGLIKGILRSAWPFILLVGFSAIYNRIDVLIISKILGYEQTGFYSAAYKIYDTMSFFPSVVSQTLFPFFATLMARGSFGEVKLNLEKYFRLMVAVALPMAVGGMVLAKPLISLIAGPQFAPAAPVLAILIWAPAILFVYIPANSLVISQLTRKAVLITGANVIINIAGNLILVPHYGIRAAAVMTVISESLQAIFYFSFVRSRITGFDFFSLVWKPALAATVMGFVLMYFRGGYLIVSLLIGVAVYASGLFAARFFTREDFIFLKNVGKAG